jgi:hypothetical protein
LVAGVAGKLLLGAVSHSLFPAFFPYWRVNMTADKKGLFRVRGNGFGIFLTLIVVLTVIALIFMGFVVVRQIIESRGKDWWVALLLLMLLAVMLLALRETGKKPLRQRLSTVVQQGVAEYIARTVLADDERASAMMARCLSLDDVRGAAIARFAQLLAQHCDSPGLIQAISEVYPRKQAVDDFMGWASGLDGRDLELLLGSVFEYGEFDEGATYGQLLAILSGQLSARGDLQLLSDILEAVELDVIPPLNLLDLDRYEMHVVMGVLKGFSEGRGGGEGRPPVQKS